MRSSIRRSTPGMGDGVHSTRAAWTAARAPKSELRFITGLRLYFLRATGEGPVVSKLFCLPGSYNKSPWPERFGQSPCDNRYFVEFGSALRLPDGRSTTGDLPCKKPVRWYASLATNRNQHFAASSLDAASPQQRTGPCFVA